ncbi:MAG: ATP-binding cassette domain-containing protein, partial [Acidimicrobiales bacterium]
MKGKTLLDSTPLLEARQISKSFGAVRALYNVDLKLYGGEVLAVVGDNGAGKSTLIKSIAGNHRIDSGEIFFEGKQVNIHGPRDSAELGIEV